MNENQLTELERELADVGRAMMDSAVTTKDDALSNELARIGDGLTRLNTIYGPKPDDFTPRDWELVQEFIVQLGVDKLKA